MDMRKVLFATAMGSALAACSALTWQPTLKPPPATGIPSPFTLPSPSPSPLPSPTLGPPADEGTIVFTCQLARDSRYDQICAMNPDGSGMRRLTVSDLHDHFYPSLDPSGQSVLFSSNLAGEHEIFEMELAGGDPIQLTSQRGAYAPAVSPDAQQFAFTVIRGEEPALWLAARDGSAPRPVVGAAWDAAWSPDGAWILHASDRSGDIQLWRIRSDGTDLSKLTNMTGLRGRSDRSPSGGVLATYAGEPWEREIYLFDQEGSSLRQLTQGGNNLAPSFSPSGEWIAFTSYLDNYREDNGCEIYVMAIETGSRFRLTENDYCDWQPRWGP